MMYKFLFVTLMVLICVTQITQGFKLSEEYRDIYGTAKIVRRDTGSEQTEQTASSCTPGKVTKKNECYTCVCAEDGKTERCHGRMFC